MRLLALALAVLCLSGCGRQRDVDARKKCAGFLHQGWLAVEHGHHDAAAGWAQRAREPCGKADRLGYVTALASAARPTPPVASSVVTAYAAGMAELAAFAKFVRDYRLHPARIPTRVRPVTAPSAIPPLADPTPCDRPQCSTTIVAELPTGVRNYDVTWSKAGKAVRFQTETAGRLPCSSLGEHESLGEGRCRLKSSGLVGMVAEVRFSKNRTRWTLEPER